MMGSAPLAWCRRGAVPACIALCLTGTVVFGMGTSGTPPKAAVPAGQQQPEPAAPSVKAVQQKKEAFLDREIVLSGRFRGWSGSCMGQPLTRSDWMFDDGTGCIYVSGLMPPGLNAAAPRGEEVVVEAVVKTGPSGAPYLSARSVRLLPVVPKN